MYNLIYIMFILYFNLYLLIIFISVDAYENLNI